MMSCVLAASSSQDSIPMRGSDDPGYNFVCSAWAERKASLKMGRWPFMLASIAHLRCSMAGGLDSRANVQATAQIYMRDPTD
uniref:Uncharacterized protein n=1 Tax=Oryza barthii TaxID=65489 RepID=A0A0D3G0G6_9ORYZ